MRCSNPASALKLVTNCESNQGKVFNSRGVAVVIGTNQKVPACSIKLLILERYNGSVLFIIILNMCSTILSNKMNISYSQFKSECHDITVLITINEGIGFPEAKPEVSQ